MVTAVMVSQWIGAHANKLSSAVRAFCYMMVGLNYTHLQDGQIGLILTFLEVALGLFTETNTVSKARMGERIEDVKAKYETGITQANP